MKNKTLDAHLNTEELRAAVWEDSHAPSTKGVSYIRVHHHLEQCKHCYHLIEDERNRNPLYKKFIEDVPEKMSADAFWKEMEKAKSEANDTLLYSDPIKIE